MSTTDTSKEPVSGLELKLNLRPLDITNDAEVKAAAELTLEPHNWGEILKWEHRGGKTERIKWVSGHLRERSRKFADGQIVAYYDGKLVGIVNTNRITANSWDDIPKSWRAAAGNYVFENYDPNGNIFVCPNVSVEEKYQGLGIASELITAVDKLASTIDDRAGHQVIEGIVPYSRFRSYKSTKDAVRAGNAMVVKIKGKFYVVKEKDVVDDAHWQELSKYAIEVKKILRLITRIKEFTPQNYLFFRRFKDLPAEYNRGRQQKKEIEEDMPYDDTPKFHRRLGAVPIGVRPKRFTFGLWGFLDYLGIGGRPADKESGGHNPILLYDRTPDKRMFRRLVSPEHEDHFTKALDGIAKGLYKDPRAA